MDIVEKSLLHIIKYKSHTLNVLEKSITNYPSAINSSDKSPIKIWPDENKIPSKTEIPVNLSNFYEIGKDVISTSIQGEKAVKSISKNPSTSKKQISEHELDEIMNYAYEQGIGDLGFTRVYPENIFQGNSILYSTCIVLLMELDKDIISKAPSKEAFKLTMSSYDKMGVATNKLTSKLRKMGFCAHAAHPSSGFVLFPPLAVSAGLGYMGKHGMLVSRKFGPRQRISAIFLDIDNYPILNKDELELSEKFCLKCGKCIRSCPANAIYETPIKKNGSISCVDFEKCKLEFINNNGCSICMKVCPFKLKSV